MIENKNTTESTTVELSQEIPSLDRIANSLDSMTTIMQSIADIMHDANLVQTEHLDEIARSTTEIAKAFGHHDGESGAVYHMAGSLNSIKFGMPNYKPHQKHAKKRNVKLGRNLRPNETVIDQAVNASSH